MQLAYVICDREFVLFFLIFIYYNGMPLIKKKQYQVLPVKQVKQQILLFRERCNQMTRTVRLHVISCLKKVR